MLDVADLKRMMSPVMTLLSYLVTAFVTKDKLVKKNVQAVCKTSSMNILSSTKISNISIENKIEDDIEKGLERQNYLKTKIYTTI